METEEAAPFYTTMPALKIWSVNGFQFPFVGFQSGKRTYIRIAPVTQGELTAATPVLPKASLFVCGAINTIPYPVFVGAAKMGRISVVPLTGDEALTIVRIYDIHPYCIQSASLILAKAMVGERAIPWADAHMMRMQWP